MLWLHGCCADHCCCCCFLPWRVAVVAVRPRTLLAAVCLGFICGRVTADQNLTQILQRFNGTPIKLPPVTCRLLIEGGTNATEIRLYGTSISRAELECTGGIIRVNIHPLLVPFAAEFKGVDITQVGNVVIPAEETGRDRHLLQAGRAGMTESRAENQPQQTNKRCPYANQNCLIGVCGDSWAMFEGARIIDVPIDLENRLPGVDPFSVLHLNGNDSLVFTNPLFQNVQLPVWTSIGTVVIGGRVEDTRGLTVSGRQTNKRAVFYNTTFTNNWGNVWGGAVTLMFGQVDFVDCHFDSNRALTLAESINGSAEYVVYRSGIGGAVLAYLLTSNLEHTFARFAGCSFHNNSAFEGGAVALMGASATFDNCTFSNNTAVQNGLDILSSLGGSLAIADSSISLASRSVDWQRVNASQCMRGEYFGDRACRRCAVSTYSLTTPSTECRPCPSNAQVCYGAVRLWCTIPGGCSSRQSRGATCHSGMSHVQLMLHCSQLAATAAPSPKPNPLSTGRPAYV